MDRIIVRKDNTYSFIVKEKKCYVSFDKTIKLGIDKKSITFSTIQELIFFTNKLVDVLDDFSGDKRGENENNIAIQQDII